jgi:hypothetical protein
LNLQNQPLYLSTFTDDEGARLSTLLHCSLDAVEEKGASMLPLVAVTPGAPWQPCCLLVHAGQHSVARALAALGALGLSHPAAQVLLLVSPTFGFSSPQ